MFIKERVSIKHQLHYFVSKMFQVYMPGTVRLHKTKKKPQRQRRPPCEKAPQYTCPEGVDDAAASHDDPDSAKLVDFQDGRCPAGAGTAAAVKYTATVSEVE